MNVDENEYREVEATLAYQTDHLYFWIENDVEYNPDMVALLAMTFESSIYPTNRSMFGSEWTPGVDNDEHLVIINSVSHAYCLVVIPICVCECFCCETIKSCNSNIWITDFYLPPICMVI